jgi:hypothetical protein
MRRTSFEASVLLSLEAVVEDAIDHLGSLPCSELLQEFDHSLLIIGA